VTALIDYFDSDQLQLFKDLCEAYYAGPRDKRHEFMAMKVGGLKRVIQGNGVNRGNDFLWEDLVALMDENLFQYQITSHGFNFVPSPRGRQFYELLMTQAGEQPDQIEDHVWHYFDSQAFERAFPITYGKWREASEPRVGERESSRLLDHRLALSRGYAGVLGRTYRQVQRRGSDRG